MAASTMVHALAQSATNYMQVSAECAELNQKVNAHLVNSQYAAAETLLSTAITSGADPNRDTCAGIMLNDTAVFLSTSGRIDEAEGLAKRSVKILEAMYPPGDLVLLRPLSVLAATQFELGKIARAREVFKRMLSIRTERPEDRAIVHTGAALLLEIEGRRQEAEAEYLATFQAFEAAGRGDTADAGSALASLGTLYLKEGRFNDARRSLDQGLAIFSRAKDAVPSDSIKLLNVRGVLQARQGAWLEAEQDFAKALSMADREPWVEPVVLRSLLTSYAYVLRRNHHRREARSIEARTAGIPIDPARSTTVDITELLAKPKHAKK